NVSKPARQRDARRATPDIPATDARRERILAELGGPNPEVDGLLFAMIARADMHRADTLRELYDLLDASTTDLQAMARAWLYSILAQWSVIAKVANQLETPGKGRRAALGILQRAETLTKEFAHLPSYLWPLPPFAFSKDAIVTDT